VWADAGTPKVTSVFLEELADSPHLVRGPWAEMPVPDEAGRAVNPRLVEPVRHPWPDDPLVARREQLAGGVALVAAALASPSSAAPLDEATAAELDLLLAERAAAAAHHEVVVEVPRHLSASDVVQLATDQTRFALSLRRPMPAAPALAARRGTAFHAWVEQHYHRAAMVDVLDLPGSADETAPDSITGVELARMKELFLASEWADRVPEAVEIAVETVLDGFAIRGRIDAVFPRDGGGFTIVDWKTGIEPDARSARHRTLQLAAYALAYARLRNLPPRDVNAAFYYAATGTTVRPTLPREKALRSLLATVPE
jgi:DNA helicase-2/ATP-dependent DNA helicase PcrA